MSYILITEIYPRFADWHSPLNECSTHKDIIFINKILFLEELLISYLKFINITDKFEFVPVSQKQ